MRFLAAFVAIFGVACAVSAQDKIPLLIIDGQNNHNWKATTPILKDVLNRSGRFSVDVATTPSKEDKAIQKFRPDLKKYAVVVLNYNGETWGKELQKDFETLVGEGKLGVVVVHAANNAFGNWNEYNQMIGMGWRGNKGGDRLYVDDSGKEVRVPNGQGDGSGHAAAQEGRRKPFPAPQWQFHPDTAGPARAGLALRVGAAPAAGLVDHRGRPHQTA